MQDAGFRRQAAGALLPDPASCIPCSVSRGYCRVFFVAFVVMKRVLVFGMVQRVGRMVRASMLATACLSAAAPAPAEVIDRVLAIVAGRVIMLSDVRGFLRLGLITPARAEDPEIETLTRLIGTPPNPGRGRPLRHGRTSARNDRAAPGRGAAALCYCGTVQGCIGGGWLERRGSPSDHS